MANPLDDHMMGKFEEKDFEYFKSFHHKDDADPYVELLRVNDVPYRLEGTDVLITEAIVGSPIFPKIILRILPKDFKQVNEIIEEEILSNSPDLENHYLYDYTDRELLAILKKPDEKEIEEIIITKEILKSRGIPIHESALENMKQDRLEELQKGKNINPILMITNMVLLIVGSVLFSPFLMIAGIGMGWYNWKDKSVDFEGNSYFTFNEKTRFIGSIIFAISVFFVLASFLLALYLGTDFLSPNYFLERPNEIE